MQQLLPNELPFYEERPFGLNESAEMYGLYKQQGGNFVTYLAGILQLYLPGVVHSLYDAVMTAYEYAGWEKYVNADAFPMYPKTGLPHPTTLGLRTAEFLEYKRTGQLSQHADADSVLTISVALTEQWADYQGGFFTLESNQTLFQVPRLSAIVFFSEASHSITPITDGNRNVLVAELWSDDDVPLGVPRPRPEDFAAFKERRTQEVEDELMQDNDEEDEDEDEEDEDRHEDSSDDRIGPQILAVGSESVNEL